ETTAAQSCSYNPPSDFSIGGKSTLPEAISMQASLVEVSPSMVILLNEQSAANLTILSSTDCDTAASVATNANMVAMLGLIIPAPLATPLTLTVFPS